jgi:hypothetical protein
MRSERCDQCVGRAECTSVCEQCPFYTPDDPDGSCGATNQLRRETEQMLREQKGGA